MPWLLQCEACSHVFVAKPPTQAELQAHYEVPGQYESWMRNLRLRARSFRSRWKLIRRHLRRGTLLDVGAGIGELESHRSPEIEVTSIEPSPEARIVASEHLGLQLHRGSGEDLSGIPGTPFDGASMIHVLEHLLDPIAALRQMKDAIKPGGFAFIAVPNDGPQGWLKARDGLRRSVSLYMRGELRHQQYREDWPIPKLDLASASPGAEIHLSHFSPPSLIRAMEIAGYEILELRADPYKGARSRASMRGPTERRIAELIYRRSGVFPYEAMWCAARAVR